MPILRSREVGDLDLQAVVETPQKLTGRQKELLREFAGHSSSETQPESENFFSKIKEFFSNAS